MKKITDIGNRAIKTFLQGFLSSLVVFIGSNNLTDVTVLKSAFIGALAGGISAVMNLVINYLNKE